METISNPNLTFKVLLHREEEGHIQLLFRPYQEAGKPICLNTTLESRYPIIIPESNNS